MVQDLTDFPSKLQAILNWAAIQSGLGADKVVWSDYVKERPDTPFISLLLQGDGEIVGEAIRTQEVDSQSPNNLLFTYSRLKQLRVQVDVFTQARVVITDKEAQEILTRLLSTLEIPSVLEDFKAVKLSSLGVSAIRNLDDLTGDRLEKRASADITFGYSEILKDAPDGATEYVETTNDVDEASGTLIIEE